MSRPNFDFSARPSSGNPRPFAPPSSLFGTESKIVPGSLAPSSQASGLSRSNIDFGSLPKKPPTSFQPPSSTERRDGPSVSFEKPVFSAAPTKKGGDAQGELLVSICDAVAALRKQVSELSTKQDGTLNAINNGFHHMAVVDKNVKLEAEVARLGSQLEAAINDIARLKAALSSAHGGQTGTPAAQTPGGAQGDADQGDAWGHESEDSAEDRNNQALEEARRRLDGMQIAGHD